jgi:uncharacterized protein YlxW (UPF0749 family)
MIGMSQTFEKKMNGLQAQNFQLEARLMQNEAKVRKYKTKLKSAMAEMQSHRLTVKPYMNTGLKDVKSPKDL